MSAGVLWTLGVIFLSLSMFSIGGANALIPELHRQLVESRQWLTGAELAHLVALAQIAPGPNLLLVSLIGWKIAGLAGLLVTTAAIVAPTSAVMLGVGRAMKRVGDARWLPPVKAALAPVVVGLMVASGMVTAQAANHYVFGYVLTLAAALYMYFVRRNPLWIIAIGAVAGIGALKLGWLTFS